MLACVFVSPRSYPGKALFFLCCSSCFLLLRFCFLAYLYAWQVVIHDGSAKNYRTGCPVEVEPEIFHGVHVRKMCGKSVTGKGGCAEHGVVDEPTRRQGGQRGRRGDCGTLKERHHAAAPNRTFGCLGSSFSCGTFGPFHELHFAESCSHVYVAQHDIRWWNKFFEISIYDDGCHQDEFWDTRPSSLFCGWRPAHRIDRMHARGHVRRKCHTHFSCDMDDKLDTLILSRATIAGVDREALGKALGKDGCFRREVLLSTGTVVPKGSRLRAAGGVRHDPVAYMLVCLENDPLPLPVEFVRDGQTIRAELKTKKQRQTLMERLNMQMVYTHRAGLSLPGQRPEAGDEVQALLVWKGMRVQSAGVIRRDGVSALVASLKVSNLDVEGVTVVKPRNTQAMEENWRVINRHKSTLRHTGRFVYDYLLHRIGHLRNLRLWKLSI
jgi:hypothetical protein